MGKLIIQTAYNIRYLGELTLKHVKVSAFDCPDAYFKELNAIWTEGDDFQDAPS